MRSFAHVIKDSQGLHARSCVILSREASKWTSKITVRLEDKVADARSMSSLLALHATRGDGLSVTCTGSDEVEAASALQALMRMSI